MSLRAGYSIKTVEDKIKHNNECHEGYACLARRKVWWDRVLEDEEYYLYGLYDEDNTPLATILLGNAEKTLQARASIDQDYNSYHPMKTFCQQPREFEDKAVIMLECIPRGMRLHSDYQAQEFETQIVKEWYENLPLHDNYLGWDANAQAQRVEISRFMKERNAQ